MTYWFPPLPKEFDPVPRPFFYTGSRSSPEPSAIDVEVFGTDPHDPRWYPNGQLRGDVGSQGALAVAIGGHAPNKPGANPWFWSQRTASERYDYYRKLVAIQADGDLTGGGLPADEIDYDLGGALRIHYWDMGGDPVRKVVTWTPDGKSHVEQWNADKGKWEGEGYDFNAAVNIGDIVGIFGAVTTAAIGYLSANPALAAAWSNLFKASSAPIYGGKPPDLGSFALSAAQVFGSAPGFGQAMSDAIVGDGLKKGLMGEVGTFAYREVEKFGKETATHLDRLRASVEKSLDAFPLANLSAMASGVVPDDVKRAWENSLKGLASFDLYSYEKAAFCWAESLARGELDSLLVSFRKAAPDKATYDATLASAIATDKRQKDYSARVLEVSSEVFHPALDPFHGASPRAKLDGMVRTLQKKYGLR